MNIVTRRRFLVASGTAGVAAAAVAAGYVSWPELAQKALAAPLPTGTPILVIVTLYGGNDGLGAVIPYAVGIEAMAVHQAPVGVTAPNGPAARAFNGLWGAVETALRD